MGAGAEVYSLGFKVHISRFSVRLTEFGVFGVGCVLRSAWWKSFVYCAFRDSPLRTACVAVLIARSEVSEPHDASKGASVNLLEWKLTFEGWGWWAVRCEGYGEGFGNASTNNVMEWRVFFFPPASRFSKNKKSWDGAFANGGSRIVANSFQFGQIANDIANSYNFLPKSPKKLHLISAGGHRSLNPPALNPEPWTLGTLGTLNPEPLI